MMQAKHPLAVIAQAELAESIVMRNPDTVRWSVFFIEDFGLVVQVTAFAPQLFATSATALLNADGSIVWNHIHAVALDVLGEHAPGQDLMAAVVFAPGLVEAARAATEGEGDPDGR